jgi:hypothetical protein
LERVARFSANLGLKLLEGALNGLVSGLLKSFGADKLSLFIENDWHIIESVYFGLHKPPLEVYAKLSPDEVSSLESFRQNLAKTVLPLLGFARSVASYFPPEAVESKVTADWLLRRAQRHLQLLQVIERYGERGRRWLEKEAEQIRDYLLGRVVFDPNKLRFVKVEEQVAKKK